MNNINDKISDKKKTNINECSSSSDNKSSSSHTSINNNKSKNDLSSEEQYKKGKFKNKIIYNIYLELKMDDIKKNKNQITNI